jgi:hypothetical protein
MAKLGIGSDKLACVFHLASVLRIFSITQLLFYRWWHDLYNYVGHERLRMAFAWPGKGNGQRLLTVLASFRAGNVDPLCRRKGYYLVAVHGRRNSFIQTQNG